MPKISTSNPFLIHPRLKFVRRHAADDVITRFHILKCRDNEAKPRDVETLSDFKVFVEQDMVEKSALDKKQTEVPFPISKVKENESGSALPLTSPTLTRSSHIDDVMSRFQILKSRDERICSVNAAKVQKMSSSNCSKIDMLAPKSDATPSPGISMKHHTIAVNKNEVDNLDTSAMARLDVLRSRGNNRSSTPAGEQFQEAAHQYPATKTDYWPIVKKQSKRRSGC